jgi:hypothetical protein
MTDFREDMWENLWKSASFYGLNLIVAFGRLFFRRMVIALEQGIVQLVQD